MDRDGDHRIERVAAHGSAVPLGQDVDPGGGPPRTRFGQMFPRLEQSDVGKEVLEELVKWMATDDTTRRSDNTDIAAGFTYLGQFIDHDITFDPMSKLDEQADPNSLVNFRTPRFDLDSVYGSGPADQPFLYDWEAEPRGTKLLVARNRAGSTVPRTTLPLARLDLPRNDQGRALIGDARNDENVIISQLHLLFLRFHNAVVDHLADEVAEDDLFDRARELVRWHYQWIVVHEFLPKVVGAKVAKRVLTTSDDGGLPTVHLEHFQWQDQPFIPVEFSGAAYRFGHSMIRSDYVLQRRVRRGTRLFPDLAGLSWLPKRLVIDWERFFDLPGVDGKPQASQLINTTIVKPLWSLPVTGKALARLNLQRGWALRLPSGQCVARKMGAPLLEDEELLLDDTVSRKAREELLRATPLWFYVLREAEKGLDPDGLPIGGAHLGAVGGRIVAEVLVGLLKGDPTSYLSRNPAWRPTELGTGGTVQMADLVEIAQGRLSRDRPPEGSGGGTTPAGGEP
jgi:Animal haem peroxidase